MYLTFILLHPFQFFLKVFSVQFKPMHIITEIICFDYTTHLYPLQWCTTVSFGKVLCNLYRCLGRTSRNYTKAFYFNTLWHYSFYNGRIYFNRFSKNS